MTTPQSGFTLESTDPLMEHAVNLIQDLLEAARAGSDEDLAQAAIRTHPRGLNKLVQFINLMRANKTQCSLEMDGRKVSFQNEKEIVKASQRLSNSNIRYETFNTSGTLTIYGNDRRFKLTNSQTSMEGSLPEYILDNQNHQQDSSQPVTVQIRSVHVAREQPLHVLVQILD